MTIIFMSPSGDKPQVGRQSGSEIRNNHAISQSGGRFWAFLAALCGRTVVGGQWSAGLLLSRSFPKEEGRVAGKSHERAGDSCLCSEAA